MSEDRNAELDAAEIANYGAETALRKVELARAQLELERTEQYVREGRAEADRHCIYNFWGGVSMVSAALAVKTLGEWDRMYPGKKFTIVFNSPGGNIIDGLALFDYIQELKAAGHEIETVSIGEAASMGGVLLQAGNHRVMGRNAFLLIHEASSGDMGKTSDIEDHVRFVKRLQDKLVAILAERSTLTAAQIKVRWKRVDWWLDAEDALRLGFVDEVR